MGGGLMQLVAYGAQDIYLTGNPQITFFKVVYRRHTNFSMEAIEQTLSGSVGLGNKVTATISRNGDLISKMYLRSSITISATGGTLNPGHTILDYVELEIGGQRIDKHYGRWMEVWAQLTQPNSSGRMGALTEDAPNEANEAGTRFQNMACAGGVGNDGGGCAAIICQVPLQFWFCRNPGLALPLIALQYHEVKVVVSYTSTVTGVTLNSSALWVDYIYLDTDERRRFAQQSHEYLIEQVQNQSAGSNSTHELNFNHPCKELIWTGAVASATGIFTAINAGNWLLKLNGHDRFSARSLDYFTKQQVYDHHTGTPVQLNAAVTAAASGKASAVMVSVYSFALKPEEHQPSGTCNFSRIDNARLETTGTAQAIEVYAVNYNVLRIMSGMGGLAYSN